MKKFKLLAIFLLFYPLFATDTTKLAEELQSTLCPQEADIECDNDTYLTYSQHITLDNDKILIFFNLFSPNSMPYRSGTYNRGVIFDKSGHWRQGGIVKGSVERIRRSPNGDLWVSHPSVIEGTSPALSYSRDAKSWKRVSFPTKRPFASIESMEFCLLPNEITLAFDNFEGKFSYWKTSYSDAKKKHPHWKSISEKIYQQKRCLKASSINNHWYKIDQINQLNFYNNQSKITTIIPNKINIKTKTSKSNYAIQVGHFKIKKSLDIVAKELSSIAEHTLISKKLATGGYKLFLGSFKTQQEARKDLEKLRRRYTKNPYIKEAFVSKLPK